MPDTYAAKNGDLSAYPYRILKRPHETPQRQYLRDISRMSGYSGHFGCCLEVHTPFEVNHQRDTAFSHAPKVPGASIKGVLRSLAEFVGGGCISIGERVRGAWGLCNEDEICPTCALFGNMSRGGNAALLKGRVRIGEAVPEEQDGRLMFERYEPVVLYQSSPKPRHTAFYPSSPDHQKFYHHQPAKEKYPKKNSSKHASTLHPVAPGSRFRFRIDFIGLSDELLGLLHFCVALEPGMLHKMGRGKAHGLGSVKLVIKEMQLEDAHTRYLGDGTPLTSLPPRAQEHREHLAQDPALEGLCRMLSYPAHKGIKFGYPGQQWFSQNPQVPLRSPTDFLAVPEGLEDPPLPSISGILAPTKNTPINTIPEWLKEEDQEHWGKSTPDTRTYAKMVAEIDYSPSTKSQAMPHIERFQTLAEDSHDRHIMMAAFRVMCKDDKLWKPLFARLMGVAKSVQEEQELSPVERLEQYDENKLISRGYVDLEKGMIDQEHEQEYAKVLKKCLTDAGIWGGWSKGKYKKRRELIEALIAGKKPKQDQREGRRRRSRRERRKGK